MEDISFFWYILVMILGTLVGYGAMALLGSFLDAANKTSVYGTSFTVVPWTVVGYCTIKNVFFGSKRD